MKMKKCVIYARYSSSKQTEQSIEGQVSVCNKYIQSKGYVLVDKYIDRATTGTNDNREAFRNMINQSKKKLFDYVIVYKLDRFSRNRYDSAVNRNILKKNGVEVLSATEQLTDSPEGKMMEGIIEAMDEYYSAELARKIKRGMLESKKKGNFTGGCVPFGYKIINKKYVIEDNEAKVIKRMFDEYDNGNLLLDISEGLKKDGITDANFKYFTASRIGGILRNERYMGKYVYKGVEYKDMIPPIIDKDKFMSVNSKLRTINRGLTVRYKCPIPYYFVGKIYCYCGGKITASSSNSHNRSNYYYFCNNVKDNNRTRIRKVDLEDIIFENISKKIKNKRKKETLTNLLVTQFNEEVKDTGIIKKLRNQITENEVKLFNFKEAISKYGANDTLIGELNDAIQTKERLESELISFKLNKDEPINKEDVEDFLSQFEDLDFSDQENRSYITYKLIDTIIIKRVDKKHFKIAILCKGSDKTLHKKSNILSIYKKIEHSDKLRKNKKIRDNLKSIIGFLKESPKNIKDICLNNIYSKFVVFADYFVK